MTINQENEYIDIVDLFQRVVDQKRLVMTFTSVTFLLGLILSYLISPVYQSTIVVSPVEETQNSSMLSGLGALSQTFGLASMSNATEDKTAMAILKSKPFTNQLFKDDKDLRMLFESRWNEEESTWINGIRPNDIMINSRFRKGLRIEQEPDTNTIHISINSDNPVFASKIANQSIDALNEYMRKEAIEESVNSQKYLNETLNLTTIMDVKNVIYNLIEEQIKKSMLANVRKDYVFRVIDYASIPGSPVRPNRTFILFISSLLGLFLSSLYVIMIDSKASLDES